MPRPPTLAKGENPVVNIYISGGIAKLSNDNIFPIIEAAFPAELIAKDKGAADRLLPKTMKKLREGGHLKILAWGDSVTDGRFLSDYENTRWQAQFATRLKERYPKADIELVTEAWSGHNTLQYISEPFGSSHNYKKKVLDVKPDLIIMEFINDCGSKSKDVNKRYGKLLADFEGIGAELIINTPHYMRPDWMGLKSQRNIDDDPREYVKSVRKFADAHNIALADVSLRFGRLWRQGIPYLTLMQNNINHPNSQGMSIYADTLIALFP